MAYIAGGSGSGDTHMSGVGKKMPMKATKKAMPMKATKKAVPRKKTK